MNNLKNMIDKVLETIIAAAIAIMVLVACWQVFTRYVLGNPSAITEEILRYTIIWTTMMGASYAYGKRKQLAITILAKKLNELNQIYLDLLIQAIILAISSLIFLFGGSKMVVIARDQLSPAIGVPMEAIYYSLIFCGAFTVFYAICFIIDDIKELRSKM